MASQDTFEGHISEYVGMRSLKRPVLSIRDANDELVYDRDAGIKLFSSNFNVLGVTLIHPAIIRTFHEAGRSQEADQLVDQARAMFSNDVPLRLGGVGTFGPDPNQPFTGKRPKHYVVLSFTEKVELVQKQEVHEASALFGATGDENPTHISTDRKNSHPGAVKRSQEVAQQIQFPATAILGAAEPYIFAKQNIG